ncbi:hypothetical protein Ssi03_61480 [Sphaerisporangium siamense]|uniref:sn-glycerol 3-phosphate transport system substrate-binding protein n=1 Tax=Sphaerisporangium siamense TaxID=795645 RepID=A0A7W7GCY8_9ACTN|nr:extracellular solute-binding protein [Sphaerisporangium siamense]MBB4702461.1 sn-glycerol 3-phosphate transport system substrate-binding protein [Sphaerisporangium siamense]GII88158.1 hypothetical protein Ssi03_61480 [Sphaerisporangium siamense]
MKNRIVIEVWVPDLTFPGWMDRWYEQAADFERLHPEYHVKVVGQDFWTFPQKVAEAAAEGRAPALAEFYFYTAEGARDMLNGDGTPTFTSLQRAVRGRTEILGETVVLDDILKPLRDYYSLGGELISMPSVGTTSLIYANKNLLRACGLSELPRTWDELDAACRAIAKSPSRPAYPVGWSNHGTFFQQALATQGGLLVDNHNGRQGRATTVDLTSEAMMTWVEWWRRLHRDGHYLYTDRIPDWAGTFKAFAEQEVVFRITSSNDVNYMVQAAKANGFDIEVGLMPYNADVPYVGNAVAGTSIFLKDGLGDEAEDGALAFLMYLHSPRVAADRHKANSFMPLTHAAHAVLEQEGWFEQHPYHRVASDHVLGFPAGATRAPGSGDVPLSEGAQFGDFAGNQDVMTRAMGDVLARGADPLTRFAEATVEAQNLLDAYHADRLDGGPIKGTSLRVEHFATAAAGRDYSAADLEKIVKLGR